MHDGRTMRLPLLYVMDWCCQRRSTRQFLEIAVGERFRRQRGEETHERALWLN